MHTPQIKQYVCASKSRGGEKLSGNTGEDSKAGANHVTSEIFVFLNKIFIIYIQPF